MKKKFVVDLEGKSRSCALQRRFAAALPLPPDYGRNLDALNDCLSEVAEPVTVRIRRRWHQPEWFRAIAKVLRYAEKGNPYLTVL